MNEIRLDEFKNKKIKIQDYQRSFEWKKEDVLKLFKSFKEKCFTGVITVKCISKEVIEIIDGQQRLTALAILFGGRKGKDTTFKFDFNILEDPNNTVLNKILNNDLKEIEDNKEAVSSGYLWLIYKIKKQINEEINDDKNKEINLENIKSISKELKIHFIDISKYNISKTFINMNNSGVTVDFSSIAKATLLENNKNSKICSEKIVKDWNSFLSKYYDYNSKSLKVLDKDYAIRQSIQAFKKTLAINVNKDNASSKKNIYNNMFEQASKYLSWAKDTFFSTDKKEAKSFYLPCIYNVFGKFNPITAPWVYKVNKIDKIKDESSIKFSIILSLEQYCEYLLNTKIFDEDKSWVDKNVFSNKIYYKKQAIKTIKLVHKILNNNYEKAKSSWNEKINQIVYRVTKKEMKFRVSSKVGKMAIFILTLLYSMMTKKTIDYNLYQSEIDLFVGGLMRSERDESQITYEHIINSQKNNSSILFGANIYKKTHNKINEINNNEGSVNIFRNKIKIYKEDRLFKFHPLNNIEIKENDFKKMKNEKGIRDFLKKIWKII